MVKKKAEPPVTPTTRGLSRRAASKEALKQMQRISSSVYEEPETFEILSDEEDVIPVEPPPKKKYKVTHRKSSDGNGNDRDILVLRTINWGEQTLNLDTWVEELSPAQVEMRKKAQQEYDDMNAKLTKYLADNSCEVVYESDFCTAYEVDQQQPGFIYAATQPPQSGTPSKSNGAPGNFQLVMDPRSGVVVGTMTPTSSSSSSALPPKHTSRKRGRPLSTGGTPSKIPKVSSSQSSGAPLRPTEANAVGGLSTGHAGKKCVSFNSTSTSSLSPSPVVDLTSEAAAASSTKHVADSREVSFNKLQGKTYPSLVVVARPHLRVKEGGTLDRVILDSKVKGVLMHVPTKFTEWLIQQGLIRSEQSCSSHTSNKLKLGMYGDVSKFPLSGGYVWISECCPQRFVSVFSGSLFEGSPHAPSVILKLIYHWCCQTNVQNVVQWVKVENLFVKGLNTWLRAICTVALHSHLRAIGGPGIRVEIGVISLGTTSQDGAQRQVKVEVLGILETETKHIRLRAVEPLSDGDKNYKKRFAKILEPLAAWVHPDSIIVTDLTVDKSTLLGMGFKNIQQVAGDPNGNQMIMDYLRRIVPRMFQNTLSLLSRQIIQQFLDELVWREWYGTSAAQAFDNLIIHASEQTRTDTGQSLILRLNRVSGNPFKNWSIKTFAKGGSSSGGGSGGQSNSEVGNGSGSSYSSSSGGSKTSTVSSSDGIKRPARQRKVPVKGLSPPPEPTATSVKISKNTSVELPEQMVPLEHYYYGTITGKVLTDSVEVNIKCVMCKLQFGNNIKLMSHLFSHAHTTGTYQCKYCLTGVATEESLEKHIQANHPGTTKCGSMYACIICETKFSNTYLLGKHMSLEHLPSELPYLCGTCGFRCSSHKQAIDHFYAKHDGGNTIQCPFCLKSTTIASGTRMITQNLNFFLQHLQKHQKKTVAKKCAKCALWFVQKEGIKDHMKMHETQRRKAGFSPWRMEKQNISVPKSLNEEPIEEEDLDITKLVINVSENQSCKECNTPMNSPNHFPSVLTCDNENCQYITCCQQAMNKHAVECKTFGANLPSLDLPCTMFCVCSFSCSDGNQLAKHLSVCERKSAYPTLEAAKSATVTHSMLDVLGLMRRPEEPTPSTNTNTNDVMEILSDDDDSVKDASLSEQIAKIAANVDDDVEDKTTDERPGLSSTEEPPKDDISDEKEPSKDKESSVEKEGSIEKDSSGEKESLAENETTSEKEVNEEQQPDEPKEPSDETMETSETLETGDKSEMDGGSKEDTSDDKIVKSVESDKIDDNEEPEKVDLNESDSNQAEKMDVDDSIDAPEESTSDSRDVDDSGAQKESINENEVPNVETPDESNQSSIDKNDQPEDKDESNTVLNTDDVSLKGNDDLLKDDDVEMATVESVSDENVETEAADKDNPDDMSTDSSIVAPVDSIESSSNPETTALIASGETDPELPAETVSSDNIQTPTLDNTGETIAEKKLDEETGAESES